MFAPDDPVVYIGLPLAAIAVGFLTLLYAKSQKNIADKSYHLQVESGRGSPFLETDTDHLQEVLPNLPKLSVQYVNRTKDDIKSVTNEFRRVRRMLVVGRTGLGKTRECIEIVKRVEAENGEDFTILLLQNISSISGSVILPGSSTRNVLIFVDDVHLLAKRYGSSKGVTQGMTFDDWLANLFTQTSELAARRLWIIATLRDEPGLIDAVDLKATPWTSFWVYRLPNLAPEAVPDAVRSVAAAFASEVEPSAIQTFVDRCDGTFMSLIAYMRLKANQGVTRIGLSDAVDFNGSYPLAWQTEYQEFIQPRNSFIAVFRSLATLRHLSVPLDYGLVIDLAARLLGYPFARVVCRRAVLRLRSWIEIEEVEGDRRLVRCPDAYLQNIEVLKTVDERQAAAQAMVRYRFIEKARASIPQETKYQIDDALKEIITEAGPLLAKCVTRPGDYDELPTLGLIFGTTRFIEAAPALIRRYNILRMIEFGSDWYSAGCLEEFVIGLAYMRDNRAVPCILDTLEAMKPGTIKNDLLETLPFFSDRDSVRQILDFLPLLEPWERQLFAALCFASVSLSPSITEEEIAEEEEVNSVSARVSEMISDEDLVLNMARKFAGSRVSKVRFRSYLAMAALDTPDSCLLLIDGMADPDERVRGAAIMMSGICSQPRLLRALQRIRKVETAQYDGVGLRKLAAESILSIVATRRSLLSDTRDVSQRGLPSL